MACTQTPQELADFAKCFACLSPVQRSAVETYLLTVLAGVDPDPEALVEAARPFMGLAQDSKRVKAVQAYLLCQIVN